MPIRKGSQVAIIGYKDTAELVAAFGHQMHFGPTDDITSKLDIPDGLQFICLNPNSEEVVPGHRNRIKSCAEARRVRVEEPSQSLLEARLRSACNGSSSLVNEPLHTDLPPPETRPPIPIKRQNNEWVALVVGAESAHTFRQKYEMSGVKFAEERAVRSLNDIDPTIQRIFLIQAGEDDDHRRLIQNLADVKGITVSRFARRSELLEQLDRFLDLSGTVVPQPRSSASALNASPPVATIRSPQQQAPPADTLKDFVAKHDEDPSEPLGIAAARIFPKAQRSGWSHTTLGSVSSSLSTHRNRIRRLAEASGVRETVEVLRNSAPTAGPLRLRDYQLTSEADRLAQDNEKLTVEVKELRAENFAFWAI